MANRGENWGRNSASGWLGCLQQCQKSSGWDGRKPCLPLISINFLRYQPKLGQLLGRLGATGAAVVVQTTVPSAPPAATLWLPMAVGCHCSPSAFNRSPPHHTATCIIWLRLLTSLAVLAPEGVTGVGGNRPFAASCIEVRCTDLAAVR